MPIPDYQTLMLPLLEILTDDQEHELKNIVGELAVAFSLTEQERKALLPSGLQPIFRNRVGWARTHLKKAGLIEATRRACFKITERGRHALAQKPERITNKFLGQYPEFLEWIGRPSEPRAAASPLVEAAELNPEEALENTYQQVRRDLAQELLTSVKRTSPEFFEQLVVDLLVNMGYGGSRKDAGEAIGKSGDEGIDGIIKEDKLGLDAIYIQAKRWEGTVSRPEIQKFVGALHGKRARKGVFITTSGYTREALDYIKNIDPKVILIDGDQLTSLMIDFGVGVSTVSTYEIKKLDSDYFSE